MQNLLRNTMKWRPFKAKWRHKDFYVKTPVAFIKMNLLSLLYRRFWVFLCILAAKIMSLYNGLKSCKSLLLPPSLLINWRGHVTKETSMHFSISRHLWFSFFDIIFFAEIDIKVSFSSSIFNLSLPWPSTLQREEYSSKPKHFWPWYKRKIGRPTYMECTYLLISVLWGN